MRAAEFRSGDIAPESGVYEELNVLGTPTGSVIVMMRGETFPITPRNFTWRPLSGLSVGELRERASRYRAMAGTASTGHVMQSLLKLAERFDGLADDREQATGGTLS